MDSLKKPTIAPAELPTLKLSPPQFAKIVESLRVSASGGSHEKRRFNRMEVEAKLTLAHIVNGQVKKCYKGLSKDISINGIGLLQSEGMKQGEAFLACLPYGKQELILTCRTTFCRQLAEGIFGVGAEFTAAADEQLVAQKMSAEAAIPGAKPVEAVPSTSLW